MIAARGPESRSFPEVSWLRNKDLEIDPRHTGFRQLCSRSRWPPYCVIWRTKESVMGDKLTVRTLWLLGAGLLGLALLAGAACNSTTRSDASALPADVQAITFLQRTPRNDDGNVF